MARITFRTLGPKPSGFNEYAVLQDGVEIASISKPRRIGWWIAWMEGERWLDAPTLADLKLVIREALEGKK